MNTGKISGILAIVFGVFTILTAVYIVATRGNAGASIILMLITLVILAFYRSSTKTTTRHRD